MNVEVKNLLYGVLRIYKKDDLELIAYESKDPLSDEAIFIKNSYALISIEAPLFKNNVSEINEYVKNLNIKNQYVLLVDHVAVSNYLPDAKLITLKDCKDVLLNGEPKGLYNNFVKVFGDNINAKLREDYEIVDNKINIKGIELNLISKGNDFNVEIPEFNAIYTHMLGHDCHSIIAGISHANLLINELNGFVEKNYDLILTSHYTPENINDVKTKILYIKDLLSIKDKVNNKEEFINEVKEKYSNYSGLNYLDMTANYFFKD